MDAPAAYLNKLDRQRKIAERLALFSPSEVFQQAASALSRTDAPAYGRFMDQTRRYREILITYFRDKKIFESFKYFTREDPAKMLTADEIVRIRTGGRFNSLQEYDSWANEHNGDFSPLRKVDIPGTSPWSYSPLDQSDVPKFQFEPSTLAGDVKRSFGHIAGLAFGALLLFFLSFVSFSRYDAGIMITHIIMHELRHHILSLRLHLALILTVMLFGVGTAAYVKNQRASLEEYRSSRRKRPKTSEEKRKQPFGLRHVRSVFLPVAERQRVYR